MAIPLKYNVRSLLVRRVSTAMTAGGIALVVAVFVIVMAMVAGLGAAITDTGSPDNMVVVRKGSTTETYSSIQLDQFDAMKFLPQIRRDADGSTYASPELPVQVLMEKVGGGRENIVVRGVLPVALKVHDKVRITQGRMFNPAVNEVIVGKGLVGRYKDTTVGSTMHFGRGTWKVVGIFDSGGSSFDSEAWADVHNVQDDTQRGAYYADVRLKMLPGSDQAALVRRIADDPRINLQAETEPEYYKDQSVVANQLRVIGMVVAIIMAVGAIFGAMNTMYAAVSSRTAEIGTLRALGFRPGAVMTSFLAESLVLAITAGAIGVVLAMPINGITTTFGNFLTFSTMAFDFRVTFTIVIEALIFAAVMGALGGWLPARQAMRLSVVDALRRS
ncbi:MAG TPA: ABC transporter permease [Candidatus Binataceae bacterium]